MAWGKAEETFGAEAPGEVPDPAGKGALSVSEAVGRAKASVGAIPQLVVMGEVTGFRGPNARSGHCYFQVKDSSAAMDCIVWRGTYAHCGFTLRDGLKVQLTGKFDIYAGSGRLSFVARSLEVAGEGLLRQQVAELARKLEREGLMDPARKRPIPRFCTRVGVVTSLSGSVIDDVKRTLQRRNPLVALQVAGCSVQGPGAPASIERALAVAAAAKPDCILLVRGGGSFEDLMTFNDEGLARAVASCPVPVVCGIGHEPDTSICDMVCDRRCSTPTAAAESVAPALDEVVGQIADRRVRLARAMSQTLSQAGSQVGASADRLVRAQSSRLELEGAHLDALAAHRCLRDPSSLLLDRTNDLLNVEQRLRDAIPRSLQTRSLSVSRDAERLALVGRRLTQPYEAQLSRQAASLDALSPLRVLARGYAIARTPEGHVVSDASLVEAGQHVDVMLAHGVLRTTVDEAVGEREAHASA